MSSVEAYIVALSNPDPEVSAAAAQVLGSLGDARGIEPLIAVLRDDSSQIQGHAASALGVLGDPAAIEPLADLMGRTRWRTQWVVATALGRLGDARAVGPLVAALEDSGGRIGESEALGAVQGLTGDARQDFHAIVKGLEAGWQLSVGAAWGDATLCRAAIERMEVPGPPVRRDPAGPVDSSVLTLPIGATDWTSRTRSCLQALGVATHGDLARLGADDLLRVRNFGCASLLEVVTALGAHGLGLAEWDRGTRGSAPLGRSGISESVVRTLGDAGMATLHDVARRTARQLLRVPGIGRAAFGEIVHCLPRWRLALRWWHDDQYALPDAAGGPPYRPELVRYGSEALSLAVTRDYLDVVEVLLDAGVPVDIEWFAPFIEVEGPTETALALAQRLGHWDLASLLQARGATYQSSGDLRERRPVRLLDDEAFW